MRLRFMLACLASTLAFYVPQNAYNSHELSFDEIITTINTHGPQYFYSSILFPCIQHTDESLSSIIKILQNDLDVLCCLPIDLSTHGAQNLLRVLYAQTEVWKSFQSRYVFSSGSKDYRIYVLLLKAADIAVVKKAKMKVRSFLKMGFYPIHTTDTPLETFEALSSLLHKPSLCFLNRIKRFATQKNFESLLLQLKKLIQEYNIPTQEICLGGSSALAAYGLRDVQDLDLLATKSVIDAFKKIKNTKIHPHLNNFHFYPYAQEEIILNEDLHFYYRGIKIATLDVIEKMKKKRGTVKDLEDLLLIKKFKQ